LTTKAVVGASPPNSWEWLSPSPFTKDPPALQLPGEAHEIALIVALSLTPVVAVPLMT
jgi:hypothetical protein